MYNHVGAFDLVIFSYFKLQFFFFSTTIHVKVHAFF